MIYPHFKETQREQTTVFLIWIVGLAMLVLGIGYFRLDVTTSALWFDGLNLRPVDNKQFDFGLAFGQTVEAWMFGIALWVAQLYAGYRAAVARRKAEKWAYIGIYAAVAILDTATDMEWRTIGFRADLALKGFLVSTVVYNLFSEMAIAVGFREVVANMTVAGAVLGKIVSDATIAFGVLIGTLVAAVITMKHKIRQAQQPAPPQRPQQMPQKPQDKQPQKMLNFPQTRPIPPEVLAKMRQDGVKLAMGEVEE